MTRLLTLPFRLAWVPIAWFLRLLGFGAGVKRHSWQPPTAETQHPMWAVVLERRENPGSEPAVRLRNDREARRAARASARTSTTRAGGGRLGLGRLGALRSTSGKVVVPIAAILALTIATAGALAYYTSTGTGSSSASVGTLNPPTGVAGSPSGSTVTVSWTAPTGGVAPQGYYVQRYLGSTPSAACGTSPGSPTGPAATSCSDTGVAGGTYTYSVTAVYRSWSASANASAPVTVAAPTKLVFTTEPIGNVAEGTNFSTQPVVKVEDALGNVVTSDTGNVTLVIHSGPGAGSLSCSNTGFPTVAVVAGVAAFTNCQITGTAAAGTYTLTASRTGLTSDTSGNVVINVGTATKLKFATQPGNGTGGGAFSVQPVVTVLDASGNTVTSDNTTIVALAIANNAGPGGVLTCGNATASGGIASFSGCKIDKIGTGYTLTASKSGGGLATDTSAAFKITTGAPATLTFTPQPAGTIAGGTAFPTQPGITVKDVGGNPVSSSVVTLTIGTNAGPGGTLTCSPNTNQATSNGSGVATFAGCAIDKKGTGYTLVATDGAANATSTPFNVVVGSAVQVAFTTDPVGAGSGAAFATQPVVTVEDAGGNTVSSTTSITLAIASQPGAGATFNCTLNPKAAVAGVDTFAGCKISGAAGAYTLSAAASGLSGDTSGSFTIGVGAATQIVLTGGASLASASSETLTATIEDSGGNTVTSGADSSRVVTFAQPTGAGSVSGLGTATASAGVATKVVTGVLAGTANLTATATLTQGSTTSNTLAVTVSFGPATKIVLSGGTTLASASSETVTATIEDAAGNTVTGGPDSSPIVTFAQPTGAGSVSGLGTATASAGVATKSVTGVLAGTANLTGAATLTQGATTSNTLAVTVTFGPATQIVLTGGTTLASASSETVTATIEDAAGNTVTSGTDSSRVVTFAQPSGAGTVSGLGTATASAGVATKSVTGVLAGTANLTASATLTAGAKTSNTLAVTVTFGPATKIVLSGGTTLASASSETLTATIEDAAGNTVTSGSDSSRVVTFAQPSGAGTVTSLGTATASGGIATKSVTGAVAGPANLTAAATLTAGATTSNTLAVTVTFGPATQIALTGGTNLTSGTAETLTATIQDAAGNTVTSGTDSSRVLTFAQPSGTGSVTGLGTATASGGIATKSVTGNAAGAVNLTATTTLTGGSTVSNTLAITVVAPLTPTSLTLQNNGGTLGEPLKNDVITIVWPRALAVNTLCSTWTNNSSNQTLSGEVDLNRTGNNGDSILTVVGSPCPGAKPFIFGSIDTGANFQGGSGSTTTRFGATSTASVIAYNATTFTVTITLGTQSTIAPAVHAAAAVATYTPSTSITDTNALAATGAVSTASIEQWGAGPATQLQFGVSPSNTATGASITPAVTVAEEDAFGNVLTGDSTTQITVAIGANPGSGTLSGTTTKAVTAGVATFSNLSINNAGTGYTLTASSLGLAFDVSNTFNVTLPTLNFTTVGTHTLVVPAHVTSVTFTVTGGGGGGGNNGNGGTGGAGGDGGTLSGTLNIPDSSSSTTLTVIVAGGGSASSTTAGTGCFAGGKGGNSQFDDGGSGGGATCFYVTSTAPIAVAGGGGGGGGYNVAAGGDGSGGASGNPGSSVINNGLTGTRTSGSATVGTGGGGGKTTTSGTAFPWSLAFTFGAAGIGNASGAAGGTGTTGNAGGPGGGTTGDGGNGGGGGGGGYASGGGGGGGGAFAGGGGGGGGAGYDGGASGISITGITLATGGNGGNGAVAGTAGSATFTGAGISGS